jgi:polyhydroxyalkanoate synthase
MHDRSNVVPFVSSGESVTTRYTLGESGHPAEPLSAFRKVDIAAASTIARATSGLSPAAIVLPYLDWVMHLAAAPGKQAELALQAWHAGEKLARYAAESIAVPGTPGCIEPPAGDDRFRDRAWQKFPYNLWSQGFLLTEDWWRNATTGVAGVSPHHENIVSFAARQWLDMIAPSNLPFSNPKVVEQTVRSGGANLVAGLRNFIEDTSRLAHHEPPVGAEAFKVGRDIAATPGKVVFRNHLIELIQYTPTTATVYQEPVLIVPAWIMKYYILDLSPKNSLIGYLVDQGHTVFTISWRNVTAEDRDLSLEDYRRLGVMAALDAVNAVVPNRKVHAAGYCLGGTLLAIAAAAMAEIGDDRLKSMTLFAAQVDFTEPGELQLFIDSSQVNTLEASMAQHGTLDAAQMAGAFQLLKSNDLIWSHMVHDYMMGERTEMTDLMAWNADTTRMPYRMHSDYLRKFFLGNDLASGRYFVDGRSIALQNIRAPIFAVATERDHVAPWRSVYKIHYLSDSVVTFVLTNGGHNAGIVSEPGHPQRHFRIATKAPNDICYGADEWPDSTPVQQGSWWPAWTAWLAQHSTAERVTPPPIGDEAGGYPPLADAPGTYVFQS